MYYTFTKYDLNGKHYLMIGDKPLLFLSKKSIVQFANKMNIDKDYIEKITEPNEISSLKNDKFVISQEGL